MLRILLFSLCFTLPSCWTIRFVQEESPRGTVSSKWHHIGLFGLKELSAPFSVDETCPNGFSYIETETSAPQALLKSLSHFWLFSYLPESVSTACLPENR